MGQCLKEYNLCVVISGIKLAVREPGGNTGRRSLLHSSSLHGHLPSYAHTHTYVDMPIHTSINLTINIFKNNSNIIIISMWKSLEHDP